MENPGPPSVVPRALPTHSRTSWVIATPCSFIRPRPPAAEWTSTTTGSGKAAAPADLRRRRSRKKHRDKGAEEIRGGSLRPLLVATRRRKCAAPFWKQLSYGATALTSYTTTRCH